MQNAALPGCHRRKRIGLPRRSNLLDGCFGGVLKVSIPGRLKAASIEGDAVMLLWFQTKNLGSNVLNGVEQFTVMRQKQRCVGAGQLNRNLGSSTLVFN